MKFLKIFAVTVAMTLMTACTSCQNGAAPVDAGVEKLPAVDAAQLTVHAEPLVLVDELPSFDAGTEAQDDVILLETVVSPASSPAPVSVNSPESLPAK